MTSQSEGDEQQVDPLAPKEAPEVRPMFGAKAYEYTLERMRDLDRYMRASENPKIYSRQYAYYEFVKRLIEDEDQRRLEKVAEQSSWRKRRGS